jgi:dipeptidyl aminopeptidase/acylaminoacyl peptidase
MKRCAVFSLLLLSLHLSTAVGAEGKRPMTVTDLFRFKRLGDPQISPDGKWIVYTVGSVNLEANQIATSLWLAASEGKGTPRQLTTTEKSDRHPRWSPAGEYILFESNRTGKNQLWIIPTDGGEARQLTDLSTGAYNGLWSPDGKHIAFLSSVYPEFSPKPFAEANELNRKKLEQIDKSPVKARVFTKLFYRHWDSYVEDRRTHLFIMTFANGQGGEPRNLTPGDHDADPTSSTFAIGDDFTFSPDGSHLLYTAPPEKHEAWSTDYNVWRVAIKGGKRECLTRDNPAADDAPRFSPDGKLLAYRAQKRAGFEADRWQLMVVSCDPTGKPTGTPRSVTPEFDSSPYEFLWTADGKGIYFAAEDNGTVPLFGVTVTTGKVMKLIEGGTNGSLSLSKDGKWLAFTRARLDHPNEVMVAKAPRLNSAPSANTVRKLSRANRALLAELNLPRPESVKVKVEGAQMQMWILKPPGFDPAKKWPLVYLVHGGPQGAWEDGWSFRWNPEIWAAQGYVIALPNPRGSTGFGQQFTDEISGDWGGKCYDDLMKGMDYLETLPYLDRNRMAAAGASFGGYMMNWFQGNTTRFKTLITHCGVYNFESMYATTEELWFDEWEHGGPPWGPNRHSYEKYSPHRLAKNFKTPMLIIHNDQDFRVPVSEGRQLFTTLQRLGVPSKFINFPDEGHWVLKPKNSEYWHNEVFAWLKKYVKPGGR